jgi:chromosome segregation ATPase
MIEMFTPEVITITIVALTASILFMFLMVFITIASLFRVKKRLLVMGKKFLELEEHCASLQQNNQTINTHIARLDEAAEKIVALERRLDNLEIHIPALAEAISKIESIEHRLDGFDDKIPEATDKIESIEHRLEELDNKIVDCYNQLAGYESKLNEHDTLLGQACQLMGKEAAGFKEAVQRIHILEEEFRGLIAFQSHFEQIRNRILTVFGGMPVEMPPQNAITTEQEVSEEETAIPSEEKLPDTEGFHKSRMHVWRQP